MGGAISARRLSVGVVGTLLVLALWAFAPGASGEPVSAPVSGGVAFADSPAEIIFNRCGAVLLATGDFKAGYCQGVSEDDPRLSVIYDALGY